MAKQQFLDLPGLSTVVREMNEKINSVVLSFPTLLEFPTIGKENTIYIDIAEDKMYRWDDNDLKYYVVGIDPNSIEVINGGGAN